MTIQDLIDTITKNQESCDGNCENCPLFIKDIPDCMLREPTQWEIDINHNTKTLELTNLLQDTVVYEIPKLKTEIKQKNTPVNFSEEDDEEDEKTGHLMIVLDILCFVLIGIIAFIIYWILTARGII